MDYTLRDIHARVGGALEGDGAIVITGVSTLELAQPGHLAFAEHAKHLPLARATRASAVVVPTACPAIPGHALLRVANPREAFLHVMRLFDRPIAAATGVHPSAVVATDARLAANVSIGECAVVRAGATVGEGTRIESGVHVGAGVVIGRDCRIGPNVVLVYGVRLGDRVIIHGGTVIGGDGFGYIWSDNCHAKVPQLGNVVIEDDVEIGSNACVDRATMGSTIIRRGTKIDNLVQIGHNDVIGEDVILTGQVGLSGSVTVGNRVMFGGQSGAADHVTIGDDARVGAATVVIKRVQAGETVWGYPARPIARAKRDMAAAAQSTRMLERLRELRAQVKDLTDRLAALEGRTTHPARPTQ